MQPTSNGDAVGGTAWAVRVVAVMFTGGLLAGCLGTSTGSPDNNGHGSISGVSGNDYSFSGGGGGGGSGSDGHDGAPGGSYSYSYSYSGPDGSSSYSHSRSDGVAGSGRLTSRSIDLSGVTSVAAGANFVVHLKTGSHPQAMVTVDDNLTDHIEAAVVGNQLRLGIKPGMSVRNATLSAEITVRQLDRLAANGASKITLGSPVTGSGLQLDANGISQITGPVKLDHLEASESGASVLALSGLVGSLHLRSAGSSQLLGAELAVADLDAVLVGACRATVGVSDTLAATADGASVLHYRGTPRITRQQTSGASAIVRDSA